MTLSRQVTAFAVAITLIAACGSDRVQDLSSASSAGSSGGSAVEIIRAEYTCGSTDGGVIALVLRTESTVDAMASLVVDGVALGQSGPVTLYPRVDMPVSVDAGLTDETYNRGTSDVRIFEVDDQGTRGQMLAEKQVRLRFPEGVACG